MKPRNFPANKLARKIAAERRLAAPHIVSAPDEKHPQGERHTTVHTTAQDIEGMPVGLLMDARMVRSKIDRGAGKRMKYRDAVLSSASPGA